ncbi:YicC/YloC family endoribonuclease [Fusibacillus kribbianus]|uniref:YicC/YloC family endoribonuclease n=1 Tax=Fusibacillus kribbianus TaxID=3044208 RepID=A0AAP4BB76_9FIRM|nr:YicC/YloC family endoribonuclease [Ruminococcus sp. YH-rum2234]MDI9241698.1 YicC/YloC family endoribonuclease [Ruminococcus sp. YH-rum2234]
MVKSMTGFGRCEVSNEDYKISVEMKSVNHRYLDLGIKMPKKFNAFEADIRNLLKSGIQRGKVDIYVTCETFSDKAVSLNYNEALAREYMDIFARMSEQFSIENDVKVSALSRYPEVIVTGQNEEDEEELWSLLKEALTGALEKFVAQRTKEGEHLCRDLVGKLDAMLDWVAAIELRSPQILKEYRAKVEDKVKELLEGSGIDENRIAAEVTLFADKICVDEETVRLTSHIRTMKDALLKGGAVGRKLDFIAQEMNREANTILSKANDLEISGTAIELKTEIEKVREQIQNIE